METTKKKFGDRDIQLIIGTLLRYGVLTSLAITLIGGIFYLAHHSMGTVPNYHEFLGAHSDYTTMSSVLNGVLQFNVKEVIQFGVIILIATPILRVAMSLVAFALEKDRLYIIITLIVLGIITTSLFGGLKL
ncbi:MAG: DUF1634 domain-containing protein [Sphingobacteriales bacterium]|nr:MAG: DUF1634 domain-containing protein [Sphingobacteriales bacterium]